MTDKDFSMAVHNGHLWVDVTEALKSDLATPIEGFTRNDIYRESMLERDKLIAELSQLVRDMWRFTGTACKKYPRLFDPPAQGPQVVRNNMLVDFELRMADLGIEVDTSE